MTSARGLAHEDSSGAIWVAGAAAALATAHREFSVHKVRSANFSCAGAAAGARSWHKSTSSQAVAAVVAKTSAALKVIAAGVAGLRAKGGTRVAEPLVTVTRATIIIDCADIARGFAIGIQRGANITFTGAAAALCAIGTGLAIRGTLVFRTGAIRTGERTTVGADGACTAVGDATARYGSADIEHRIAVLRTATIASCAVSAIDLAVPIGASVDARTAAAIAACREC